MKLAKELKGLGLCSVDVAPSDTAYWGWFLGGNDEWIAMRTVFNTGEIGPIAVFRTEDVHDVAHDTQVLAAVSKIADTPELGPTHPERLLAKCASEGRAVTLGDSHGDEFLGLLIEVGEDWVHWRMLSPQGVDFGERLTRIEQVRVFELDGPHERRLERVLSRSS